MSDIKAMVVEFASKMEPLPVNDQKKASSESHVGQGFVLNKPLKEEVNVAFISSKKNMAKESPIPCDQLMAHHMNMMTGDKCIHAKGAFKPELPTDNITGVIGYYTDAANARKATISPRYLPNVTNLNKSISKVSNLIKEYLHVKDVFNDVKFNIKDKKMYAETFYTKIQNCIYHSLREFCHLTKDSKNVDVLPEVSPDFVYFETLIFFDRIFNDRSVSYEKDPMKVMENYRKKFTSADGIASEWVDLFVAKVKSKGFIEAIGIETVAAAIMGEWGNRHASNESPVEPDPTPDSPAHPNRVGNDGVLPKLELSPEEYEEFKKFQEHLAHTSDELDPEEEEFGEDEDSYMKVSIIHDDKIDVVRVETSDEFGRVSIPFYTKLSEVNTGGPIPSIVDDRNGIWDWLIHFSPDLVFKTKTPDRYMAGNDDTDCETILKCVILDENEGVYTIGVYCIESIVRCKSIDDVGIDDYEDETIRMINRLVNSEVASGYMSHLGATLNNSELFKDEDYVLSHIIGETVSDDHCGCHDCDEEESTEVDEPAHEDEIVIVNQGPSDLISKAALDSVPEDEENVEVEHSTNDEPPAAEVEVEQPTSSVVPKHCNNDEEGFTFAPIRRGGKLHD